MIAIAQKIFKKNTPPSVLYIIIPYIFLLVWWVTIFSRNLIDTFENYFFGLSLGLLAIICGLTGITKARPWGGFRSYMGRAVSFLSFGFITWGIGTLIIAYYNFKTLETYPYPSLADAAYIASWPLWFIGMFNLSKATGARSQFSKLGGKLIAGLIVLVSFILSYYLLIQVARGGVFEINLESYLRLFFDFAYPVGDIVILTTSLVLLGLSFNYLGGVFKLPILLVICGFILNYTTDIIFTYTNTLGTFYVASWVDVLYVTTFFLLGLSINLFDVKLVQSK